MIDAALLQCVIIKIIISFITIVQVMLKDVADSKRINSHITEQRDKEQSEAPEEATKKKEVNRKIN